MAMILFCYTGKWSTYMSIKSSMSDSKAISDLVSYCSHYGYQLNPERAADALSHLRFVLDKNEVINLTSITSWDDALVLHVLDSLLFVPALYKAQTYSLSDSAPYLDVTSNSSSKFFFDLNVEDNHGASLISNKTKVADMGTGAGFPGIPIACMTDASVVLLDSVNKKILCCHEFVNRLELNHRVDAVHCRLEEYGSLKPNRESFDFVVARALASLDVLIEYAAPLIKRNGCLILSKGNPDLDELSRANAVSKLCGFECVSRETLELPNDYGHREFFTFKKVRPSSVKLPRKNGEARRNPLAALNR